jgi:hypothetical protein
MVHGILHHVYTPLATCLWPCSLQSQLEIAWATSSIQVEPINIFNRVLEMLQISLKGGFPPHIIGQTSKFVDHIISHTPVEFY